MIKVLKTFDELIQYRLPFLAYTPQAHEAYDISVRIHDLKWPTLRYRVRLGGREIRLKQFFLDWFFPGFPKSMLSDFSAGYSDIRSRQVNGYILFLGKNYRKNHAASAWIHGTTVEMDSPSTISDEEYENLLLDILEKQPDPSSLSKYQFPDRSHFAGGYGSQWYEDRRIARLNWRRTPSNSLVVNNLEYKASGLGYIDVEGKAQEIYLFQEGNYSKAIWIEKASKGIAMDHAIYDVRKGKGLFDTEVKLAGNLGLLVFRRPSGPGVLKADMGSFVLTAGFSPGIVLEDISSFVSNLDGILVTLKETSESVPHEDANL